MCARSGDRISSRILVGLIRRVPRSQRCWRSAQAKIRRHAVLQGEVAVTRPAETVERAQVQLHEQESPGRSLAALVELASQQSAALARAQPHHRARAHRQHRHHSDPRLLQSGREGRGESSLTYVMHRDSVRGECIRKLERKFMELRSWCSLSVTYFFYNANFFFASKVPHLLCFIYYYMWNVKGCICTKISFFYLFCIFFFLYTKFYQHFMV